MAQTEEDGARRGPHRLHHCDTPRADHEHPGRPGPKLSTGIGTGNFASGPALGRAGTQHHPGLYLLDAAPPTQV